VDSGWAFFGEVGLGGEIRAVGQVDRRLQELHRLGFHRAIAARPTREGLGASPIETLGLCHVGELRELLASTGKKRFDG
jgi:DNA repair protein RadA/Sms